VEKTNNRFIVAITGKNAAGKGEACNILTRRGYSYKSLSDVVRNELHLRQVEPSRENLIAQANTMRRASGPGVLARKTVETLPPQGNFVIDSVRHPEEVKILMKAGKGLLLAVDAPIEVRFNRAMKRGRNENANTLKKFESIENLERTKDPNSQQLDETFKIADVVVENETTLQALENRIVEILKARNFPLSF
jgi:dephospho-CoA kinase